MSDDADGDEVTIEDPTALRWVGPSTAEVIDGAEFDADGIADKSVSYRMLVDAGANAGVAAKIRREHSLAWSFDTGADLERRSAQVRGLQDEERSWVADSYGDDDASGDDVDDGSGGEGEAAWVDESTSGTEADGSGDPVAAEAAWRQRSAPTPLTELEPISPSDADRLADAGVTSVGSLATADPELIADRLELPRETVEEWHEAARDSDG